MTVFHDAIHHPALPVGGVGTIGNFDGVHRGQRAIIDRLVAAGRTLGLQSLVVTFEPHPVQLLEPAKAPLRLSTPRQKTELLRSAGVDHILVVNFDREFSRTTAKAFAREFLFGKLDLRELYVGSRFVFGRDREGDLALLESVAATNGRRVEGVPEVLHQGQPISSTRIRRAVGAGEVELAGEMLGRSYTVTGEVARGAGKGRDLGWPTINLEVENELLPAVGVYASAVRLDEEQEERPAVTNVGVRPTLHRDRGIVVESHILDFEGDLYGRRVRLDFRHRLRGERRFSGVDELTAQISRDAARARELVGGEIGRDRGLLD